MYITDLFYLIIQELAHEMHYLKFPWGLHWQKINAKTVASSYAFSPFFIYIKLAATLLSLHLMTDC